LRRLLFIVLQLGRTLCITVIYDVADVQFTVEKEGPLALLQLIQKYNLGTLFQI